MRSIDLERAHDLIELAVDLVQIAGRVPFVARTVVMVPSRGRAVAALLEAIPAVDRLAVRRLERHFAIVAALLATRLEELESAAERLPLE